METAKQLTAQLANQYERTGVIKLTKTQFLDKLDALGYRLLKDCCTNYHNVANKVPYLAKSTYYLEKDTGLSAFNVNARRDDNFKELQRLRQEAFVFERNRVWEL